MTELCISAAECITPIGRSLEETNISLRSGIQRFKRTFLEGTRGRIRAAPAFPISTGIEGAARAHRLAGPPLDHVLRHLSPGARVGLAMCLPRWGFIDALPRDLRSPFDQLRAEWATLPNWALGEVARRGIVVSPLHAIEVVEGQPSAIVALAQVEQWLGEGLDAVVLLAIASDCERAVLEAFDAMGFISREGEVGGYTPGEAGVALLFSLGGPALARVAAYAAITDPESGQGSPQAIGLTLALHQVLDAALPRAGAPVALAELFTDAGLERWRAREIAIASLRALAARGLSPKQIQVARQVADVGCAGGALNLALAAHAVRADGRARLCSASTRGPLRGAVFLRGEQPWQ